MKADDILIFARNKKKTEQYQRLPTKYLTSIHPIINEEKTIFSRMSDGIKNLG